MADTLNSLFMLHLHVLEQCGDRDLEAFAESASSLSRRIVDKIRMQRYTQEELEVPRLSEEEDSASSSAVGSSAKFENARREAWLGCKLVRAAMEFNKRSLEGTNEDSPCGGALGSWIHSGWSVHTVRCHFNDEDPARAILYLRRVGPGFGAPTWMFLNEKDEYDPYFAPGLLCSFEDIAASGTWSFVMGSAVSWQNLYPIWYREEDGMQRALRACSQSGDRFGGANFPGNWGDFMGEWASL